MSVINQMLKDLEQRTPEQGQAPLSNITTDQKPSTIKIVLISVVVLLSLNAFGFYLWDLQERVAKNTAQQNNKQPLQLQKEEIQTLKQAKINVSKQPIDVVNQAPVFQTESKIIKNEKITQILTLPTKKKEVAPLKKATVINKTFTPEIVTAPNVAKMSVSRRQLTSQELVLQKLTRAQKAINLNKIIKAEQLFEEILIIEPEHKQARKKLAALWFGRKLYQQAVNLLSQGIAIDKQDGELRLLKARIYLSQGQLDAAYNTLIPLASFEQEEYQVTLANTAQQIEQYLSAISAYQRLINMQPYSGRWHLGLAIVYDKNSQFSLAINEYTLALTKTNLSASSAKFAQQRMQALGE